MDGACFHSNEEAVLSLSAVTETELLRAAGLVFVEVEQEIRLLISPQSSLTTLENSNSGAKIMGCHHTALWTLHNDL